jgi:hypothetical protein
MLDKGAKMSIVVGVMSIVVLIIILILQKKDKNTVKGIDADEISDEMKSLIAQKQADAVKQIPKDKSSFPLLIGSEGDNVKRLQTILGVESTGKLNASTLDKFKLAMSDIPEIKNLDKVSEASIVLLENYTKDIEVPEKGDNVIAKKELRLSDFDGWDPSKKEPIISSQKRMKVFGKDEAIGEVQEIVNNTAVVKAKSGRYYIPKLSVLKK